MNAKYWTQQQYEQMKKANNLAELLIVAFSIIDTIPRPRVLVSGPISTGGAGSIEANVRNFWHTITTLEGSGLNVFNQLPFESKMVEFSKNHDGYYTPILDEFFLPILKSGKIDKVVFMKDWKTSKGARWEHETSINLKIDIDYI